VADPAAQRRHGASPKGNIVTPTLDDAVEAVDRILGIHKAAEGRSLTNAQAADYEAARSTYNEWSTRSGSTLRPLLLPEDADTNRSLHIADYLIREKRTRVANSFPGGREAIERTCSETPYRERATTIERSDAMRAIDRAERSGEMPDHAATRAERLLAVGTPREQSVAARWAATTGDPAYSRAFMALLADPTRGHLLWTPEEGDAYRRVAQLQSEMRAYGSLTDNVGGYMVPLHLDPAIILSGTGTTNAMRKVSRVVQTVSESWQGVTSAGVTAEWIAENSQVAEATPVLASVPIPVYKGDAFVPYSFEVGDDAVNFGAELQLALVDAADTLMATAYTVGTGSGQPTGVVQALLGGASKINGTGSEAIIAADAYAIQAALPPRFSARARFHANIAIINTLAQLETTGGNLKFPDIENGRLLNKPLDENSDMDGAINPAATADNYVLLYGDFTQYIIVDRIGSTLEIIPHLFGANYRPTGSRGALLWFRTGGNVGTINAFRLLDVPTTA
jgi:HK97 family phage major capsid protein